jgi:20S proteasome alpha/beta subunit
MGAKCTDGVALVGDRKITVDYGTSYSYTDKIVSPAKDVVVGSSGSTGFYRTFQSRLILGIQEIFETKGVDNVNWKEELVLLGERVIHGIADSYGARDTAQNIDALVVTRTGLEPELIHLTGSGLPEPVIDYTSIGHGKPYASIILKSLWRKHSPMSMEMFSKIGCLAIKYVQDCDLDNSVGIEPNGVPQVWYIPEIPKEEVDSLDLTKTKSNSNRIFRKYAIRELSKKEVNSLMLKARKNVEGLIESIENSIL